MRFSFSSAGFCQSWMGACIVFQLKQNGSTFVERAVPRVSGLAMLWNATIMMCVSRNARGLNATSESAMRPDTRLRKRSPMPGVSMICTTTLMSGATICTVRTLKRLWWTTRALHRVLEG